MFSEQMDQVKGQRLFFFTKTPKIAKKKQKNKNTTISQIGSLMADAQTARNCALL